MTAAVASRSLLVELLVEELPPKALKALGEAFASGIVTGLLGQGLLEGSAHVAYATPRRLAVLIEAAAERAADRRTEVKLMPASVGYGADGAATPSLRKKLEGLGIDASAVERRTEGKAEFLYAGTVVTGATLAEALQRALDATLTRLPIPKVMQYQLADGWTSVSFVRPAHGLVALHGDQIVPVRALGLEAGRTTRGHRFEARLATIALREATTYAQQMRDEGAVIASFAERRTETARQLDAASTAAGLAPVDDAALLDEVTGLVEWPNVLTCEFEPVFLEVPPECLILTMKANQKYFPLLDADGRLTPRFLVVSNIAPADPGRIVEGNERVVRPRLADARFFFDQDRKATLASRVGALDRIVYHGKLGSQGDRSRRVGAIAARLVEVAGGGISHENVARAALLAKADLTTDMVGEFPELQGTMGRYYALHDGEEAEVAQAIADHYRPRFAGDALPEGTVGRVVALADKVETVAGLFAAGERPTGDKDPYALRRAAIGLVRLLVEGRFEISLLRLFGDAVAVMPGELAQASPADPAAFVVERAKGILVEQGFAPRAVEAVLGSEAGVGTPLHVLFAVVPAADRFLATPEGDQLAQANKRITNILRKSGFEVPFGLSPRQLKQAPDASRFVEDEERALHASLHGAGETALALKEQGRYAEALEALLPLSAPTQAFFARVMVNADDPAVRDNRITLLQHARAYMNQVADLTLMAG